MDRHARARCTVALGTEEVVLLPDRAALRVQTGELLVSDVHLGKDEAFVRAGRALPLGETARELDRLAAVLRSSGAARLTILGDFTHHRFDALSGTLELLSDWLQDHASFRPALVCGNHDRHAQDHLRALPIELLADPSPVRGVEYRHAPPSGAGDLPWIAGHVHPGLVLDVRHDRLRVPIFWVRGGTGLVLPAFGEFTGLFEVAPAAEDRAFAAGAEAVVEVPHRGLGRGLGRGRGRRRAR